MANVNAYIQTFAGGEFGDAMSARVAIDSYQASCELMENWFMLAQGPMIRRPSLSFIDSLIDSSTKAVLKGFEFDVDQNYLLLLQEPNMYFYLNDGILDTDTVTATISNGAFSNFTGWTDNSDSGASAGSTGTSMFLMGNGSAAQARARTTFTVNEANSIHILAFDVINGPVSIKIGTSAGGSTLLDERDLRAGHHRLAFTPTVTGTTHLQFYHEGGEPEGKNIDNVQILTGIDTFSMPIPWTTAQMRGVFTAQDGDRLYMFHRDKASRVLERRGHRSWSLIYFEPNDGPFDPGNDSIRLTSSGRNGSVTITTSESMFKVSDLRRLIRVTHQGQYRRAVANHANVYSDPIKVSGIGASRAFTGAVTITGTATATLERSVNNKNDFSKVITVTATTSNVYNDSYKVAQASTGGGGATSDAVYSASGNADGHMDNQTVYYRWAIKSSDYTSGIVTTELSVDSGSQTGVIRLTGFTNGTTMAGSVISAPARTTETDIWDISSWNDADEWPNVVTFAHGRLWPFRRKEVFASVSDDYFSFDDGIVSDTVANADRTIRLNLRSKSAEGVRWARELDFLCIGTRDEEYVIRSTNAADPVGPSTAEPSLQGEEGGAAIEATIGGDSIIFIHRNGRRVMQFAHNPKALSEDSFVAVDLTRLNPEAVEDGVVGAVVQQEPERRIFAVTKGGIVKPALFRREEEIMGWGTMTTAGVFEDAHVLREASEDATYFLVRRYINGGWVRMIERLKSEVTLNDEDLVHLDSMLETPISRPDALILPSSIDIGAASIMATEDVFSVGDVGKVLWNNGGHALITAFTDARNIDVTIRYPFPGKLDYLAEGSRPVYRPTYVASGRWGIAQTASSVTGLDHLEGETVHIWADMAYRGTAVVSGGAVTLSGSFSRIFVGLNFTSVWKGLKIAYGAAKGTAITQPKKVNTMGLVLDRTSDTVVMGDTPGKLRRVVKSTPASLLGGAPRLFSGETYASFEGSFDIDPRIIIATLNPGPATIKALIPNIQVNER